MTPQSTLVKPPRLAVQAFWLTFSKVISALINLILPIFLVRVMSQTEYGVYKQVFLFVGTAVSMATLGVGMSAFYFLPRAPGRGGEIVLNIMLFNFFVGSAPLLVLAFYPQVMGDVFRVPGLIPYALLLGILVLFQTVATFLHQIPSAMQDVKYSTLIIVGSQTSRAMIFAIGAIIMPTVRVLMIAGIVHQIAQTGMLVGYLHAKFGRFWRRFDRKIFIQQIRHAVPLGLLGILGVLRREMHNYFVSASFTSAQFAIYAVGCLQTPLVPVLVESVTTVLVVRVSELQHQGRHREILLLTAKTMNRLAGLLFPIVGLLFVTRRELIVWMYTRDYEASADIYAVNLLLLPIAVLALDPIVQAYKDIRKAVFAVQFVVFAAMVAMLYVAIERFGMVGAIAVAVIANMVERLGVLWAVRKHIGARWEDIGMLKDTARVAVLVVIAIVVASLARERMPDDQLFMRLAISSAVFGSVYVPAMFLLRLPGHELFEKDRILRMCQSISGRLGRKRPV